MKLSRFAGIIVGLATVTLGVSYFTALFAQPSVPEDPRPTAVSPEELLPVPEDSIEVQTSGPIHEAFATPLTTEVPESIVVNGQPPEPIEELPPEQRPEGSNVMWVPGYFGWDETRNDFLWISGFWRDVPPGRVWVSGYWTEAADGHEQGAYQWVPGFWTAADQPDVAYLPQPPEIVESGPSIEQPSTNHFWVPGHWSWGGSQYAWRPGYWSRVHPDWVWVPAHYSWCPSGYVFVDGYWDYPVVRRGLLFAPVFFQRTVYRQPYYYTPSIVWSTHLLTRHLWVRPAYYHYYFGDYYDDRFVNWGIRPWHLSFTFGNVSYDPLFSYYRWRHRDIDWSRDVRDRYDYYRRNRDLRPPRTYRDQQQIVSRAGNRNVIRNAVVAAPITQIVNNTTVNNISADVIDANFRNSFRFNRVAQPERRRIAQQSDELRSVVRQRREVETRQVVALGDQERRERGQKGEDSRARQSGRRSLDISNLAQSMSSESRSRSVDSRQPGDERTRGRAERDAKTGRPAARDGADVSERAAQGQRPDRGRGHGRVRPEADERRQIDRSRARVRSEGQDQPERGRSRSVTESGTDARRPPDATRLRQSQPELRRQPADLPELPQSRGSVRGSGPTIPQLPGVDGAEPRTRRSVPPRGSATERSSQGDRARLPSFDGAPRERRIPTEMFRSDPANVTRRPGGLDRAPSPDRVQRTSPRVERDVPRPFGPPRGGAVATPPEASGRSDMVAPLRFNVPQRTSRTPTARPETRSRPDVPSARSGRDPRSSAGSVRGGEASGGRPARGRDRDDD